jgi:predicted ATPase/DNA-binding XRE family transcriptional regulator
MDTVASLLRTYRLAAGLSQAELAERANISVGAIGSLEQGIRKSPYPATLHSIADALELPSDQRELLIDVAKHVRTRKLGTETASSFQSNVPTSLTSFIWREETGELAQLSVEHRLVTVTGSAGVGKTRTVLEVVAQHGSSDVYFIDFSPITDGAMVAAEVASAFGVPGGDTTAILPDLASHIGNRRALIVLDNCEHVLGNASATVLGLLRSCPGLRFLVTSREPLGLSGEVVFRLPSLAVPPVDADLTADFGFPALELFVARARTADARIVFSSNDLKTAADICRRLGGIPLAIELAAGLATLLGVGELRNRLNVLSLDTVAKDIPARHQTMAAAIAWSFTLLTPIERALMRRLSTFAGGFTLACAEAVAADEDLPAEVIARLVVALMQKSLIEPKAAQPVHRYYLLDSVRAYAASELAEAGDVDATADRLARWLLSSVRPDDNHYSHSMPAVGHMLPELDNIRAAIEAKLRRGTERDIATAGELVGSYRHLWMSTSRRLELRQLCEAVSTHLDEAKFVNVAALLATALAGTTQSFQQTELLERAIELNTEVGDFALVAAHLSRLSYHHMRLGRSAAAMESATRAHDVVQRIPRSHQVHHTVLAQAASVFAEYGEVSKARQAIAELDKIKEEQRSADDPEYQALRSAVLAEIANASGDYASAAELCRAAFDRARLAPPPEWIGLQLRLTWSASVLNLGHVDEAAVQCKQVLLEKLAFADTGFEALDALELVRHLASIAGHRGDFASATRVLSCSDAMYDRWNYRPYLQERRIAENLRALLDAKVDPDELVSLKAEGARMTLKEARELMTLLLGGDPPSER